MHNSQLADFSGKALAGRCFASGLTFVAVLGLGQYVAGAVRIYSTSSFTSRFAGASMIAAASIFSRKVSLQTQMTQAITFSMQAADWMQMQSGATTVLGQKGFLPEIEVILSKAHSFESRTCENVVSALAGLVMFVLLGGTTWSVLPSNVGKPGAFRHR